MDMFRWAQCLQNIINHARYSRTSIASRGTRGCVPDVSTSVLLILPHRTGPQFYDAKIVPFSNLHTNNINKTAANEHVENQFSFHKLSTMTIETCGIQNQQIMTFNNSRNGIFHARFQNSKTFKCHIHTTRDLECFASALTVARKLEAG